MYCDYTVGAKEPFHKAQNDARNNTTFQNVSWHSWTNINSDEICSLGKSTKNNDWLCQPAKKSNIHMNYLSSIRQMGVFCSLCWQIFMDRFSRRLTDCISLTSRALKCGKLTISHNTNQRVSCSEKPSLYNTQELKYIHPDSLQVSIILCNFSDFVTVLPLKTLDQFWSNVWNSWGHLSWWA